MLELDSTPSSSACGPVPAVAPVSCLGCIKLSVVESPQTSESLLRPKRAPDAVLDVVVVLLIDRASEMRDSDLIDRFGERANDRNDLVVFVDRL